MKEFFLPQNGLYYRKNEFESARPTFVFVHGLSGSSSAWAQYEKILEKKYNLLSFDLRGHGKSPKPKEYGAYKLENFTQDLYELTAYLNLKKFILVSHSFGTLIALEFLAKYQDEVSAAVFLSPSFKVRNRKLARLAEPLLAPVPLLSLFPFSSKPGWHVDYSKHPNSGDWNVRRMFADISNTTLRVYLYCTKQSYAFDRESFLERIKIPVLILHGKKDTIFPVENSIIMSKKIKNAKLILLDGADHIIALNNAPEICEAMENFAQNNKNSAVI